MQIRFIIKQYAGLYLLYYLQSYQYISIKKVNQGINILST
jgi:hypothetical protein